MAERLEDLLRACTVRVLGGPMPGAGFFVAPGKVVTCFHVIGDSPALMVRWERDGRPPVEAPVAGRVLVLADRGRPIPALDRDYPDLAVLEVAELEGHPSVGIDTGWPAPEDGFQVFGYPQEGGAVQLTAARLTYRGTKGIQPTTYLDLASDTVKPGMSGAAVLNLRSGAVCGVIVASKHPAQPDGALAIPWSAVDTDLSEVLAANRAFHLQDRRWTVAVAAARPADRATLRRAPDGGPEAWHQAQPRRSSVAPPWGLLPVRVRGRDDLIAKLGELATSPDGQIHVLSGLGGNGKTTVALAVADRAQGTGPAWWISGRDRPSLDSGLLDLASALGITSEQLEQARTGVRSLLDLIWEQLNAAVRTWVLVVDNADSPELLATDDGETRDGNGVTRGSTRGLTIVTSRNGSQEVWGSRAVIHIVDPLDIQDGADVLLDLCEDSAGSKQDAVILAQRLGGLPLALRAAGLYLSSTGARLDGVRTFTAYCRDLDTRFAVLQGPLLMKSDPRDIVLTTWEASLDLLAERGVPQARTFMRMVGQFAPAPIPVEILDPIILGRFRLLAYPEGQEFEEAKLRQVVTALCDLGLLDLTDHVPTPRTGNRERLPNGIPCLVAHPLVVEVNATKLTEEPAMQEAATTTIVDLVSTAAGHGDPRSPSDAATWPLLAPHIELLAASMPRLPREVVVRFAEAANYTATGLRHGGDYTGAYHLLVRALEATRQLGPEHPAVLELRHSYAYVIDDMGRFSEAEDEYRSILAALTSSLGAQDLLTLSTRNHLAFSLSRQNKLREAEAEYREVLEARQRLLGPDDQDTLTTQTLLGDVLHGQKRYAEAETQYETVLEAQLRLLGRDHPRTLITRNSLARNRSSLGRYTEAQEELRAILALRRSTRGPEHPSTLATWHDLAVSLAAQGHSGKARQEFRGVLDARRRVLGETHPDTLATAEALRKVIPDETSEPQPQDTNQPDNR